MVASNTARFSTEVRRRGCTRRCGAWAARVLALGRLVDEGRDHGLGHIVVGDDAVFERVLGGERVRRVVDHVLGLVADGQHALSGLFYGDNGGLVDDDALPRNSNKGIGSARSMAMSADIWPVRPENQSRNDIQANPSDTYRLQSALDFITRGLGA